MLHSALPRAYLAGPAGMGYLAAATGFEDPYAYDAYARHLLAWEQRAPTPCPLDLSLKPAPVAAPAAPSAETQTLDEEAAADEEELVVDDDADSQRSCSSAHSYQHHHQLLLASPSSHSTSSYQQQLQLLRTPPSHHHAAPMTPPSTPSPPQCPALRRKDSSSVGSLSPGAVTPSRPSEPAAGGKTPRSKRKHARKLKFDEDTSSPVSGTVILGPDEAVVTGDIDPAFNIVEVTEEARAELAKIENRLGPYQCKLCRQLHEDAFQLAQHRCSRIAHVEYRCPECDKRFSCPANLASHRRWHKPRPAANNSQAGGQQGAGQQEAAELACGRCDAKFSRQAALRKHVAAQHPEQNNNVQDEEGCKQQQLHQVIGGAGVAMEMA